ncbi:MAG: hypothetical protein GY738_00655 [Pseudoalteromonas sp.]|nr:hypothetical protein [Pseudoalteromonas sp.]
MAKESGCLACLKRLHYETKELRKQIASAEMEKAKLERKFDEEQLRNFGGDEQEAATRLKLRIDRSRKELSILEHYLAMCRRPSSRGSVTVQNEYKEYMEMLKCRSCSA